MKKIIKVNAFDPKSIEEAINELEEYKKDVERRARLLLEKLTEAGVKIAKAKVVEYGIIHDNNLTNSINGFIDGNVGYVRVNDEYAMFFEFGTGPVGKENPHPMDGVTYRTTPWYTQADGKDMAYLYDWTPYIGDDGSVYYLASGQPAKPFMYDTALKLRDMFPSIVEEVFG